MKKILLCSVFLSFYLYGCQVANEIDSIYYRIKTHCRMMIYNYREAYGTIDDEIKLQVRKYLLAQQYWPIARRVLEELEERDFRLDIYDNSEY